MPNKYISGTYKTSGFEWKATEFTDVNFSKITGLSMDDKYAMAMGKTVDFEATAPRDYSNELHKILGDKKSGSNDTQLLFRQPFVDFNQTDYTDQLYEEQAGLYRVTLEVNHPKYTHMVRSLALMTMHYPAFKNWWFSSECDAGDINNLFLLRQLAWPVYFFDNVEEILEGVESGRLIVAIRGNYSNSVSFPSKWMSFNAFEVYVYDNETKELELVQHTLEQKRELDKHIVDHKDTTGTIDFLMMTSTNDDFEQKVNTDILSKHWNLTFQALHNAIADEYRAYNDTMPLVTGISRVFQRPEDKPNTIYWIVPYFHHKDRLVKYLFKKLEKAVAEVNKNPHVPKIKVPNLAVLKKNVRHITTDGYNGFHYSPKTSLDISVSLHI